MTEGDFKQACMQFLNIPYKWGGATPLVGLDCSGLVQELLSIIGIDPPGDQTAFALMQHFEKEGIASGPGTGSLVFYGKNGVVSHVGMMISPTHIIEAGGGGSTTSNLDVAKEQDARVRIRRFDRRSDIVKIIKPKGLPWE